VLAPVLNDVCSELRMQAQPQGIELELRSIPEGSVACSEAVLTSLVSNLVRNAIKYMDASPEKRIVVRVRDADRCWRVEVEDTGPGIAPADQLRIFEAYVQLDKHSSGIGLGLATVDRLVRAHGGTVGLVSPTSSGRGSLFWFELPKRLATQPAVVA
jgi:signal transduction histidine kinase